MSKENPYLGAAGIHGELLMVGFEVAQSTVSKYTVWGRPPSSQAWKTFLQNHTEAIAAIDICAGPTLTFDRWFEFLALGHDRRQLLWIEVMRYPTAKWLARQITNAFPLGISTSPREKCALASSCPAIWRHCRYYHLGRIASSVCPDMIS
jgi:hypothetical protein